MKRTGFAPKFPRREPTQSIYTPRPRAVAVSTGDARMSVAVPKQVYLRSEALRVACRALPCQHCGAQDGTVCAAHSNWGASGKGLSIKGSDESVAALCWLCHAELDQGAKLSKAERMAMWQAAHEKTVAALKGLGRWPEGAE